MPAATRRVRASRDLMAKITAGTATTKKANPQTVQPFWGSIVIDRPFMQETEALNPVYHKYFDY